MFSPYFSCRFRSFAAGSFLFNTWLTALALALENGRAPLAVWRDHALYLGVNYYAAASIATLAVENGSGLNVDVLGLVAPLLILSYATYKQFSNRSADRDHHAQELEQLYRATIETLAVAVDAKGQVTHGHIRRVQRHTIALAKALGIHDPFALKALEAASLLHDIGKLAVPDYVLNKPGSLSASEFETMKLHAPKGATILDAVGFPYPVVPIVRHHHEQWNGRGYPDGVAGDTIPLGARILSVVDCFDAVTSDRPYRRKLTDDAAIELLRARSGTFYDPTVVDAFIALIPQLRLHDRKADAGVVIHFVVDPESARVIDALNQRSTFAPEFVVLGRVGRLIASKMNSLMPHAECCLFAADATGERLLCAHASAGIQPVMDSLELRVGEGLSGWVAANRHTIVNSHPDLDLRDAAAIVHVHACMSTPVFAFGNIVGVLTAYTRQAEGFSVRETRIIATLAQEAGLDVARHDHHWSMTSRALTRRMRCRRELTLGRISLASRTRTAVGILRRRYAVSAGWYLRFNLAERVDSPGFATRLSTCGSQRVISAWPSASG